MELNHTRYLVSISPKQETVRIIQKTFTKKGKRLVCNSSDLIQTISIKEVTKINSKREVTHSYFDFGLQHDTFFEDVVLWDFKAIQALLQQVFENLDLPCDYFFASKELTYTSES